MQQIFIKIAGQTEKKNTHTHIHTHTYIHTYTHTHTQSLFQGGIMTPGTPKSGNALVPLFQGGIITPVPQNQLTHPYHHKNTSAGCVMFVLVTSF